MLNSAAYWDPDRKAARERPVVDAFATDELSAALQTSASAKRREDFFKGDVGAQVAALNGKGAMSGHEHFNGETPVASRVSPPQQPAASASARYAGARDLAHPLGYSRDLKVDFVGFANVPNQVYRRAIKQGFDLTLMVVGRSGLGKSTFINSLFLSDVYPSGDHSSPRTISKSTSITESNYRLIEKGVTMNLTLVDTPGFGDGIDNSGCWQPIASFIDGKCSDYFTEETKMTRTGRIVDRRVHCCFYFIPAGHGLLPLDVECMKQLHDRVNIVPVIAKADTFSPDELAAFKKTVYKAITDNAIKIYKFPDLDDEAVNKELQPYKERVPFAVVGSNLVRDVDGKKVRYRKYPWGTVEVENLEHNDFVALRSMVIRTHLIDLIDVTRAVHYENFRCRQLMVQSCGGGGGDRDPLTQMEQERRDFDKRMEAKQVEFEGVFKTKKLEKEQALREKEAKQLQENQLAARRKEVAAAKQRLLEWKTHNPQLASYDSRTSVNSAEKDISPNSKSRKSRTLGVFR